MSPASPLAPPPTPTPTPPPPPPCSASCVVQPPPLIFPHPRPSAGSIPLGWCNIFQFTQTLSLVTDSQPLIVVKPKTKIKSVCIPSCIPAANVVKSTGGGYIPTGWPSCNVIGKR